MLAVSKSTIKNKAWILLLPAFITLAACETGIEQKRDKVKYEGTSKRIDTLEVPPNLTNVDNTYRVNLPEQALEDNTVDTISNNVLTNPDNVEIKRDGQIRWLVVKEPVDKVWPGIISFWEKDGVPLITANPATGVVETDWLVNYADFTSKFQRLFLGLLNTVTTSGQRDKYRMRVDNGEVAGTTDIYLTHLGLEEVEIKERNNKEVNDYEWQSRNSDPNLEAEVLRLLMVHLGVNSERAEALANDGAFGGQVDVAKLVETEKEPVLLLNYDQDSAWRRVGAALDRMDVVINGYNREAGVFGITVEKTVPSGAGLFKRVFTKATKETTEEVSSQVRIIAQDANITVVAITTEEGIHDSSEYAVDLLRQLHLILK